MLSLVFFFLANINFNWLNQAAYRLEAQNSNINRLLNPIVQRVVEPQALIQPANAVHLALVEIPTGNVQVLRQPPLIVALRDDGHVPLRGPTQQHLRGRLPVPAGNLLDGGVVHEQRRVLGALHVEFEEGLRTEGRVGRDGYAVALCESDETFLGQVGVVFDLEGCGGHLGVAQEVHDELAVEVADADGFGQAFAHEAFHGRPCLLDGGVPGDHVLAVIGEAGWVSLGGVDVFEGDGEVDNVEVKVVDAPILKLLFADGLDAVMVVERVPELGDEEEVGTLDYAFFDGASDALAAFLFVSVVWKEISLASARRFALRRDFGSIPHAPSKRRYPDLMAL